MDSATVRERGGGTCIITIIIMTHLDGWTNQRQCCSYRGGWSRGSGRGGSAGRGRWSQVRRGGKPAAAAANSSDDTTAERQEGQVRMCAARDTSGSSMNQLIHGVLSCLCGQTFSTILDLNNYPWCCVYWWTCLMSMGTCPTCTPRLK